MNGLNRPTKIINGEVVDKEEKKREKNNLKGVQTNTIAMNLFKRIPIQMGLIESLNVTWPKRFGTN